LRESQRRVVDDGALQAAGVASGRASVQRGAAAVGIGTTEHEITAAVFHQTASAGDGAEQRGVLVAGQGQLPTKVDGIGQLQRRGAVEAAVAGHAQCTAADGAVVAQHQRTASELRAAAVGVAAVEGQARSAGLDQAACTADHTVEGQGVAASDAQATVHHHIVAQRDGRVAVQCGAVCGSQDASAQRRVITDDNLAAVKCGATGVAVGGIEHQRTAVVFAEGAAAVERYANGRGGVRIDSHRGVTQRTVDQVQRTGRAVLQAVAIGDELQAGDGLRAVDGDRAGCALEHCEIIGPGLIGGAVDVGPVGGAGAPVAAAAIDRTVGDELVAVPELHGDARCGNQQIDLVGQRGLQGQIPRGDAARHRADQHAVVGQAAGVVDQPVHAAAKTADVTDVEGAVEGQVAANVDQRIAATGNRHTEADIEVGIGV